MRSARGVLMIVAVAGGCAPVPAPPPSNRVVDYDAGSTLSECAAPGSRQPGEHCRCEGDCAGDTICLTEAVSGYPQGLCAAACLTTPSCDAGYGCDGTVCYRDCQAPSDCPAQANCVLGQCLPFCIDDSDCLSGNCNHYIGSCLAAGAVPAGAGLDAACQVNADCKSGVCSSGHCVSPCSVARGGCPEGGICARVKDDLGECFLPCTPPGPCASADRRCSSVAPGVPPACIPTGTSGCFGKTTSPTASRPCGCDGDCDPGSRCLNEGSSGFPQGLCLQTCTGNGDCTSPDVCYAGACFLGCTSTDQCDPGRLCLDHVCAPYCVASSDCLGGQCNAYSGQCRATPAVDGGIGATCTDNASCKSGDCQTNVHPDGQCLTYCSTTRNSCPDSAICVPFSGGEQSGFCALGCATAADCPQASAVCRPGPDGGFCD